MTFMFRLRWMVAACCAFAMPAASQAAESEWPQFRGPDGQGVQVSGNVGLGHALLRLTEDSPVMLGHFELAWVPGRAVKLH